MDLVNCHTIIIIIREAYYTMEKALLVANVIINQLSTSQFLLLDHRFTLYLLVYVRYRKY
jgi:hypothetical protein